MWKSKAPKFRDAIAECRSKEEWLTGVSAANLPNGLSTNIKCSTHYIACQTDTVGSVVLLPLRNKEAKKVLLQGHTDVITDFDFCPCGDNFLASASHDGQLNVWNLPSPVPEAPVVPQCELLPRGRPVCGCVVWNPITTGIVACSSGDAIKILDLETKMTRYEVLNRDVQSLSWKFDGSLVVTTSKDKIVKIIDPRTESVTQECSIHSGSLDTRIVWLGDLPYILSTGFSKSRQREVVIRDHRNLTMSLKTLSMDASNRVFMPYFDIDTNMVFLTAKGDTTIRHCEVSSSEPYLLEGLHALTDVGRSVRGAALVPKLSLDIMECEVNRVLILTDDAVVPVSFTMPKKTHRDFHADIFPDTFAREAAVGSEEWIVGVTREVKKLSLDPAKNPGIKAHSGAGDGSTKPLETGVKELDIKATRLGHDGRGDCEPSPVLPAQSHGSLPAHSHGSLTSATHSAASVLPSQLNRERKSPKVFAGVRHSKFKHLVGSPIHRKDHLENLRNLSTLIPAESDMFQVNSHFSVLPLAGPGGNLAVFKVTASGRLPDAGLPFIHNASAVMDFVFDPFDDCRLAVACDDATIKLWSIPSDGLNENLMTPTTVLRGHSEKVTLVRFHPMAADVLASASFDMMVRLWDVHKGTEVISLPGHPEGVLAISWSCDGRFLATVCKDGVIRVFDPRHSQEPVKVTQYPRGARGARLVWACDDQLIILSSFDSSRCRLLNVYEVSNMATPVYSISLDASPPVLVPHYDEDSSTLFLTGRGDGLVRTYEVSVNSPYLLPLSDVRCDGLHQALAFLPKSQVDVRTVEFARALRLTQSSVVPMTFTVPRIKMEFFQDDLFPDTKVKWSPVLTASEWFSGRDGQYEKIGLKPVDMDTMSSAQQSSTISSSKKTSLQQHQEVYKTEDQKKEELISAVNRKIDGEMKPLPQDLLEGVAEDEWED